MTAAATPTSFTWVDLVDDGPLAERLRELGLGRLVVEDMVATDERPKIEHHEDGLLVVMDAADYDDLSERIRFGRIRLFVRDDLVVTVRADDQAMVRRLRRAWESERWRPSSTLEVLHAIVDRVVDGYDPVSAGLGNDVREIEQSVFQPGQIDVSERIYFLKRQVLAFRSRTRPLVGAFDDLAARCDPQLGERLSGRLRDVDDHLDRTDQELDEYSDLLTNVLEANLAQISVRQNEDMRRMSAWAAIFLLPTLLAGVWGMNFDQMPETDWRWGYPFALAVMAGATSLLYWRLRRAGWL